MADKESNIRTTEIFWSKEDSDSGDNGLIPVTGLKSEGNKRPVKVKKSVKGRKTKEVMTNVVGRKPKTAVKEPSTQSKDTSQASHEIKDGKKASLKDLCLEDKKRVANLIKELARLGEEKETMSDLLENERELFEDKINEVLQQQSHILKERENIESQLKECQQLIETYQQVLKEKEEAACQEKLAKEVEVERYSPIPKQHSNYNADLANTTTKSRSSYRNFPEALKNASTPVPESNQSTVYKPKPPQREPEGDRPFTSMIDKLIDEERNRSSRSVEDREIKLGPFINPKFVNIQNGGGRNLHGASTDFQPLPSECTSPSIHDNGTGLNSVDHGPLSTPILRSRHPINGEQEVEDGSQLSQCPNSSMATAPIPEGLNDREFLQQYRELNPEQRKQQLFVQKQALLQEQERLKKILNEQEKLLEMKQEQLRKQQDIQKERLNYFDRTGTFPPNYDYSELRAHRNEGTMAQPPIYPGMNTLGQMYAKQPFMPVQPLVNQVVPPHNMAYNPGVPMMLNTAAHPFSNPHVPVHLRQEGLVGNKEFSPNKENHNVSTSTRQTRSACTSPMPSNYPTSIPATKTVDCGTSPIKSQGIARNKENQTHSKSNGSKSSMGTQKHANDYRGLHDYRDERASQLLDLVDEVESLHNRSSEPVDCLRPYLSPSRKEKPQQISLDPFQDSLFEEDSDELDEPRLSLSGLIKREPDRHMSHVIGHEPHVNRHNSHVNRHEPHVNRHEAHVNGRVGDGDRKVRDLVGGWGSRANRDWEAMEQSSEDLEESQVLEDVFFIK